MTSPYLSVARSTSPSCPASPAVLHPTTILAGAKALQGRDGLRVRVGNYRIIYTVKDDLLLVVVVTLGHRRDVYDR